MRCKVYYQIDLKWYTGRKVMIKLDRDIAINILKSDMYKYLTELEAVI